MEKSATARTAVIWSVLRGELAAHGDQRLNIVDLGGGTGGFAVPLAVAGHTVTVVDPSPDALASLIRRAADARVAERVHAQQGDADSLSELVAPGSADLVLCHSVLEVADGPAAVVQAIAKALRVGGAASVLVGNRAAAVLARAMAGQWRVAGEMLHDPARFDAQTATKLLAEAGLTVEQTHGVRVVADLVPGVIADTDPEAMLNFELSVAGLAPYRDVATQLHLLARR